MALTTAQLVEMLDHDEDTDIWLLNEDGTTSIVPDQDIVEFQNLQSWPRYICRSMSINEHVAAKGVQGALDYVNFVIDTTIIQRMSPSTAARLVIQALRRKATQ